MGIFVVNRSTSNIKTKACLVANLQSTGQYGPQFSSYSLITGCTLASALL